MVKRNSRQRLSTALATGLIATCLAGNGAMAAEESEAASEDSGPNLGALTISVDNSFTTAYLFRGILNIRDGFIWQPSVGVNVNLFAAKEGVVQSVDLGLGMWSSVQHDDVNGIAGSDGFYEARF